MTWVAYHSDLSEVAVFERDSNPGDTELRARRYAMEHHMDLVDLPDSEGLRETINGLSRPARAAAERARLLGPDIPHDLEPPLVDSDLAALVRETLDLQGSVNIWYSQSVRDMVHIERRTPGDFNEGQGQDLSEALCDYRVKEARRVG